MNLSFIMGALTGWIAFTPEGRKFGDTTTTKIIKYIQKNMIKENKNDNKRTM